MFSKKKKDKGFTLVELIIVVAILAILVGLLAPQYTKYVEKSRKSADINNLNEIVNAIKIAATDSDYNLGSNENPETFYTIVIGSFYSDSEIVDTTYLIKAFCDNPNQIVEALTEYAGLTSVYTEPSFIIDNVKIKSNEWGEPLFDKKSSNYAQTGIAAHIVLNNTTGAITVTYSDNVVNYLNHGTIE